MPQETLEQVIDSWIAQAAQETQEAQEEETLTRTCEDCGEEFELEDENDEETLCEDCKENYFYCGRCGDRFSNDEEHWSSSAEESYCEYCYDGLYTTCEYCGNEVSFDDANRVNGDYYCRRCFCFHFTYCEHCGQVIDIEESYYSESREETLCEDCFRDRDGSSDYLHRYHDFDGRLKFYNHIDSNTSHDSNYLYLGVELETDSYDQRGEAADELYRHSNGERLFHMEQDSSLSNGIEIISMPCTLDYHRNSFPWAEISSTAREYGAKSNDVSTCGLHIHFNRSFIQGNEDYTTLKLLYVFEKFWESLVKFSRRKGDDWKHYAQRYYDEFLPCYDPETKLYETRRKGRYFAVNLRNENTIEIRLFKGTLKVSTILASLEMVDYLVRLCRDIGIKKLQQITWAELTGKISPKEYPNLVNYLAEKNLIENKQLTLAENEQEEN